MNYFILVSIRDEEAKKYYEDSSLKQIPILPHYREGYLCFSAAIDYSFHELISFFSLGNDSERIGSISIIAENFPDELYKFICCEKEHISDKLLKFLLYSVIPDYLPFILPKDRMLDYEFSDNLSNDIWVKILGITRSILKNQIQ